MDPARRQEESYHQAPENIERIIKKQTAERIILCDPDL